MKPNKKKNIVGIIHYDSGNVGNLLKTVKKFTKNVILIRNKKDFDKCNKIILPGVGSFGIAINFLKKKGLIKKLKTHILSGGHTLGICLGMQILYKSSQESENYKGIGVIKKVIKKIDNQSNLSVPHVGWNNVVLKKKSNDEFHKITKSKKFYYSHSFADKTLKKDSYAYFKYGKCYYTSIVKFKNLLAVQFHPELSGKAGLKIFNLFLDKI